MSYTVIWFGFNNVSKVVKSVRGMVEPDEFPILQGPTLDIELVALLEGLLGALSENKHDRSESKVRHIVSRWCPHRIPLAYISSMLCARLVCLCEGEQMMC